MTRHDEIKGAYKALGKEAGIIDVMKSLPARRVMAGGMIGPVAAFLYCVGFCHIVLMTNEQSRTRS